jgi:hypothetical protein
MSRRDRRAARSRSEELDTTSRKPIYVYFVVYAIIAILLLGLLSLLFVEFTTVPV